MLNVVLLHFMCIHVCDVVCLSSDEKSLEVFAHVVRLLLTPVEVLQVFQHADEDGVYGHVVDVEEQLGDDPHAEHHSDHWCEEIGQLWVGVVVAQPVVFDGKVREESFKVCSKLGSEGCWKPAEFSNPFL